MSNILIALSIWLHSLATIVFIGHYLVLALIYLPVLTMAENSLLSRISRRSRGWMYASLLVFAVTGVALMYFDPNYRGVGNFGNIWSVFMLVKHILILVMIVMGFWFNAIQRVGPLMSSNSGGALAFDRFQRYCYWMAGTGILVLLLTALSQAQ